MTRASKNNKHQYIGQWQIDYNWKLISDAVCASLTSNCISSFSFDLNEAYNQALQTGRGSFKAKFNSGNSSNSPEETCCMIGERQLCENNRSENCKSGQTVDGELSDITENGAKITIEDAEIYNYGVGKAVVLEVKKK